MRSGVLMIESEQEEEEAVRGAARSSASGYVATLPALLRAKSLPHNLPLKLAHTLGAHTMSAILGTPLPVCATRAMALTAFVLYENPLATIASGGSW